LKIDSQSKTEQINCQHCSQAITSRNELAIIRNFFRLKSYHKNCYKELIFDRGRTTQIFEIRMITIIGLIYIAGAASIPIIFLQTLIDQDRPIIQGMLFTLPFSILLVWPGTQFLRLARRIDRVLPKGKP
jgi:hypothetical protein